MATIELEVAGRAGIGACVPPARAENLSVTARLIADHDRLIPRLARRQSCCCGAARSWRSFKERMKMTGDRVSLVHSQLPNLVPVGAAPVDSSSNMKVHMRDGLVCVHTVVLPNA